MSDFLIVILGPTGVGKTDTSFAIAGIFNSHIISCDSRQFYSEMRIGTSVPADELLQKVPHHFIRFLSVHDYYSSSLFERDVLKLLPSLFSENRIVLMTGGSGLYIDSVCDGIDDIPDVDPPVREKYTLLFRKEGIESLRVALKMMDPEHYKKVDLKNHKRIIRALEICETTGRPYSTYLDKSKQPRNFITVKIGLTRPRDELYSLINSRVDRMIGEGLEEEARSLFEFRNLNALNTVGYKEFFDHFEGNISHSQAIELIKRNTRRYSKRQMTWWSRDKSIVWFHPDDHQRIADHIRQVLEAQG